MVTRSTCADANGRISREESWYRKQMFMFSQKRRGDATFLVDTDEGSAGGGMLLGGQAVEMADGTGNA